ncbi:unnamed protein product [Lactuca virosa]|uniref:Uncharacterized protein n=1 Tax=Lactuca virosa TaxID=75947 RepID=A0AAU9P3B4_9ASTR|nr:unnamed protein product [Lactuca virosa]
MMMEVDTGNSRPLEVSTPAKEARKHPETKEKTMDWGSISILKDHKERERHKIMSQGLVYILISFFAQILV